MAYNKRQKLKDNLEAIKTAFAIRGGKPLTPKDKETLLSYSGFGGLKFVLHPEGAKEQWQSHELPFYEDTQELFKILRDNSGTPSEYREMLSSLRNSVLTSFYTPDAIVAAIAKAMQVNGIKIREFLDPSSGKGTFIRHFSAYNPGMRVTAYEKDKLSGLVLQSLTDKGEVHVDGYETISSDNKGRYDVVSSNIPFGDITVFDPEYTNVSDEAHRAASKAIHNYFFMKSLDMVREGGLVAFITSRGVMDSPRNEVVRRAMMETSNLVSAIRLPDGMFRDEAGTDVGSDLIILQKTGHKSVMSAKDMSFILSTEQTVDDDTERKYVISSIFANGGNHIADRVEVGSDPYGKPTLVYTYDGDMDSLGKALEEKLSSSMLREMDYALYNKGLRKPANEVRPMKPKVKATSAQPVQLSLFDFMSDDFGVSASKQPDDSPRRYEGTMLPHYRVGIYLIDNGQLGYLSSSATPLFTPKQLPIREGEIMKAYIPIRDTYEELYRKEAEDKREYVVLRQSLNKYYDAFVSQYGALNLRKNMSVIITDVMGRDMLCLETAVEGGKGYTKADIFDRPVSFSTETEAHVDSVVDALSASLNRTGVIDLEYMSSISGIGEDQIKESLKDRIFYNPISDTYELSDKFLSGNVLDKIESIRRYHGDTPEEESAIQHSLEALEHVKPIPISYKDLDFNFGERWMPMEYFSEFATQFFDCDITIRYAPRLDEFVIDNDGYSSKLRDEYAVSGDTKKYDGLELLRHALYNTVPTIQRVVGYKADGSSIFGPDHEKIQLAASKIDQIREGFTAWIEDKPIEWKEALADRYNRKFNCFVRAQYDGSHQTFPDLDLKALRESRFKINDIYQSQKDCVWMLLQNGGGICDHEVGTGKTLIMCMAAYEMKRLGLVHKPVIIGMKANVSEIASTYQTAYPNARVLYASDKDFKDRQQFFNRMKNNDYDCIIMSHDQFGMIPQSPEIQKQVLEEEILALDEALEVYSRNGGSVSGRTLSGLEKRKENLRNQLSALNHTLATRADDVVDFKTMGIDHIFVDESQVFKNLAFTTRDSRVAGLGDPKGSQRARNLQYAIRTIQERTGKDLGVTFLSGTTISNSLTELYLLFKYLRPQAMSAQDINSFDAWAAVYARKSRDYEINVAGSIVMKERFRNFIKVPELASFYNEVTDYRTANDVGLDRPNMTVKLVNIKPTEDQKDFSQRLLQFAESGDGHLVFRNDLSDSEKQAKMLLVTNMGKKCSLSPRLVNPDYKEGDDTKIGIAAKNISEYYHKYEEHKGTQFVFCDLSTPKKGEWNVYQELKDRLVTEYGIPEEEIAFIQEATTEKKKKSYIEKMNKGEIRIMVGSTTMLGTGVNAQERAVAVHHLDLPWRPSDLTQRNGRAVRKGNEVARLYANNNVDVLVYAVERSLDSYNFYLLQAKSEFIEQMKRGTLGKRTFDQGGEDENNGIPFAEYVAITSGNDDLLERAKLEKRILGLESERKAFLKEQNNVATRLSIVKDDLNKSRHILENLRNDQAKFEEVARKDTQGNYVNALEGVGGAVSEEDKGKYIQNEYKRLVTEDTQIATLYGFPVMVKPKYVDGQRQQNICYVKGNYDYTSNYGHVNLSSRVAAASYALTALTNISSLVQKYENDIERLKKEIPELERISTKSWEKQEQLSALKTEMQALDRKIQQSMDISTMKGGQGTAEEEEKKYTIEHHEWGRGSWELSFRQSDFPYLSQADYREVGDRFHGNMYSRSGESSGSFLHQYGAEEAMKEFIRLNDEHKDDLSWLVSKVRNVRDDACAVAAARLRELGLDRFGKPLSAGNKAINVLSVTDANDVMQLVRGIADKHRNSLDAASAIYTEVIDKLPNKENLILVPMPYKYSYDTNPMAIIAEKVSEKTGVPMVDLLQEAEHQDIQEYKREHPGEPLPPLFFLQDEAKRVKYAAKTPVILGKIMDTGHTFKAVNDAFEQQPLYVVLGTTVGETRGSDIHIENVEGGLDLVKTTKPEGVGYTGMSDAEFQSLLAQARVYRTEDAYAVSSPSAARKHLQAEGYDWHTGAPLYEAEDIVRSWDYKYFDELNPVLDEIEKKYADGSLFSEGADNSLTIEQLRKVNEVIKSKQMTYFDSLMERLANVENPRKDYRDLELYRSIVINYEYAAAKIREALSLPNIGSKESEQQTEQVEEVNTATTTDYNKPLNSLQDVKTFLSSIGYDGDISKTLTSVVDGRKFVKFNVNGVVRPNIFFGETTPMNIFRLFHNYKNTDVNIPEDVISLLDKEQDAARSALAALNEGEQESVTQVLDSNNISYVKVIDSEYGSRIVLSERETENGNYTDYIDVRDAEDATERINEIKSKAASVAVPQAARQESITHTEMPDDSREQEDTTDISAVNNDSYQRYQDLKANYGDVLLLFRLGDFYETYCDDAVTLSKELGINLFRRSKDEGGWKKGMELAGFPHHDLDIYLPKLVRSGHRVAISDVSESVKRNQSNVLTEEETREGRKETPESLQDDVKSDKTTEETTLTDYIVETEEQVTRHIYNIEHRKDTRDNSDLYAVTFAERVSLEEFNHRKILATQNGGYWSNFGKKGFLFRLNEAAIRFAESVEKEMKEATRQGNATAMQYKLLDATVQPNKMQKAIGEALVRHLRDMGIDVSTDVVEMRKVVDENAGSQRRSFVREVSRRFGEQLSSFDKGAMRPEERFALGTPSAILLSAGLPNAEITMTQSVLRTHMRKHNLTTADVRGLVEALQEPMMVYDWGSKAKSHVIITNTSTNDGRKIAVAVRVGEAGVVQEINEIASVHGKSVERMLSDMNTDKTDFRKENLRYVDKEKALDWLGFRAPLAHTPSNQELDSAAKIINDFENPKVSAENILQAMTVFHGSPHSFERFDHSHMGEGEGLQAHGWGSYVAVNESTGMKYAEQYGSSLNDQTLFNGTPVRELIGRGELPKALGMYLRPQGVGIRVERVREDIRKDLTQQEELLAKAKTKKLREYYESNVNSLKECLSWLGNVEDAAFEIQRGFHLYEVEIPDDNGDNYLNEKKGIGEEQRKMVLESIDNLGVDDTHHLERWIRSEMLDDEQRVFSDEDRQDLESGDYYFPNDILKEEVGTYLDLSEYGSGRALYEQLKEIFGSDKAASEFLSRAGFVGLKYNGWQDGECYVIFDDKDLTIKSHEQYLKTRDGETYGFVVGGKIYIDPTLLNPNTPIHEYSHLWTNALMVAQPELWSRGKELMKQLPLWEEVKNDGNYKDIAHDEDLVGSEVFARLVGDEGEKFLYEKVSSAALKGSPVSLDNELSLVHRITDWLKDAFSAIRSAFGHTWTKEELSTVTLDELKGMTLKDFAEGFNPTKITIRTEAQARFIGEHGAERLDRVNNSSELLDNLNVAREMERTVIEKKERIEKLRNSAPIEITGREIEPSEDLRQYRKNANEYGLRNLRGEYINKDTGDTIIVAKNSIKEVTSHDASPVQYQSVAAIPQILEEGIYIDTMQNEDIAKHGDVVSYDYYVCGLNVGSIDYTVKAVIANGVNGERYYDHRLTEIEKGKLISLTSAMQNHVSESNNPLSEYKDRRLFSILQTNEQEIARKIKIATGWERGADGEWRYEQSDFKYRADGMANLQRRLDSQPWKEELDVLSDKIIDGEEPLTESEMKRFNELSAKSDQIKEQERQRQGKFLDDYIEDDTLFKAYPQLKRVRIEFYNDSDSGVRGYYDNSSERIAINLSKVDSIPSTLAHEIQHAIQHIEGFARGGNILESGESSMFYHVGSFKQRLIDENRPIYPKGAKELDEKICEAIDKLNMYESGSEEFAAARAEYYRLRDEKNNLPGMKEYTDRVIEINDAVDAERQRIDEKYGKYHGIGGAYEYLGGEVESRNVQSRMEMSAEERRQSLASETEDVSREDQLFIRSDAFGEGIPYSEVTNSDLKKRLESEPTVKAYRAMQLIDGRLYPPMAARIKGDDGKKHLVAPIRLGEWEQSDEHPELVKDGKFVLDKANGTTVPAAYNPYIYTSRSPLNDQFSTAYKRPNLVTVEVKIPVSELTSGYKAEGAKDAVGEIDWHSGPVSSQLAKAGDPRKVILTRYDKPVRIIPDVEVAARIAEKLRVAEDKLGYRIPIPSNTITPSLRKELEKQFVLIQDNTPSEERQNKNIQIMGSRTQYSKGDSLSAPSDSQRTVGELLVKRLRDNGINVINDLGDMDGISMHTSTGVVYGYTKNGTIYVDPIMLRPETPIHEYTHLWANAVRLSNPEKWGEIVTLMKSETKLWSKVQRNYPELTTADEIADEVLAHYSGKRGEQQLMRDVESLSPILDKILSAINKFWEQVATMFSRGDAVENKAVYFSDKEAIADTILEDLMNGYNPRYEVREQQLRAILSDRQDNLPKVVYEAIEEKYGAGRAKVLSSQVQNLSLTISEMFSEEASSTLSWSFNAANVSTNYNVAEAMVKTFSAEEATSDVLEAARRVSILKDIKENGIKEGSAYLPSDLKDDYINCLRLEEEAITDKRLVRLGLTHPDNATFSVSKSAEAWEGYRMSLSSYLGISGLNDIDSRLSELEQPYQRFTALAESSVQRFKELLANIPQEAYDRYEARGIQFNKEISQEDKHIVKPLKITTMSGTNGPKPAEQSATANKDRWANYDYSKNKMPEGVTVEKTNVFKKNDGKYAVSAIINGERKTADLYYNDVKAFFERGEDGAMTKRVTADMLVAKYFAKSYANKEEQEVQRDKEETKSEKESQSEEAEKKEEKSKKEQEIKPAEKHVDPSVVQTALLTGALAAAVENNNVLAANPYTKAPSLYGRESSVSPLTSLLLTLDSEKNGYDTNVYITLNAAKEANAEVRRGNNSFQLVKTQWGKYVNRYKPEDVIDNQAYKALPQEEKSLYKKFGVRKVMHLFNVDQTLYSKVHADEYNGKMKDKIGEGNERQSIDDKQSKLLEAFKTLDSSVSQSLLSPVESRTPTEQLADSYRAAVAYTGAPERINRVAPRGVLPDDASKYELLVQEVSAASLMVRAGQPAVLSKEGASLVPYWTRELTENPRLFNSLEKDVRNAVHVVEAIENGQQVNYEKIKGEKATQQLNPQDYTVIENLNKQVSMTDKNFVLVKDEAKKTVDVILPEGASLSMGDEVKGMSKNRIVIALGKDGYPGENIHFYNAGGEYGLKQTNTYFEGKRAELSQLKQYTLIPKAHLDFSEYMKPGVKNVRAIHDDDKNIVFHITPIEGKSFVVRPESSDIKAFFNAVKAKNYKDVIDLGRKYIGLVSAHPDLKLTFLVPKVENPEMLKHLTSVNISKSPDKENANVMWATIDGKKMPPKELTQEQFQRLFLVEDQSTYKAALATHLFSKDLQEAITKSVEVQVTEGETTKESAQQTVSTEANVERENVENVENAPEEAQEEKAKSSGLHM